MSNKGSVIFIIVASIIIVVLCIIGVNMFINQKKVERIETLINKLFDYISDEKIIEANMLFKENYNNKELDGKENLEDLKVLGYVDYLSHTDYSLAFYKTMKLIDINVVEITKENTAVVEITVERPNYLKLMFKCDEENIDNENYDFESTFISKLSNNEADVETKTSKISLQLEKESEYLIYDDEMKELIYGVYE